MAEEKKTEKKELMFIIPLRREFLNAPRWRRAKRAINAVQDFLEKHTKADEIKIGKWLNEHIWGHGAKNPPGKVKVKVTIEKKKLKKEEKTIASCELAILPSKAKRLAEKEVSKKEAKKKREEARKSKEEEKIKEEEYKKKKDEEKKELEKLKEQAKITKEQEMAMHKNA